MMGRFEGEMKRLWSFVGMMKARQGNEEREKMSCQ